MPKIDLIELKTFSELTWINKTRGTQLHLVMWTKTNPPSLAREKLLLRLDIDPRDLKMPECTPEVNSVVSGITFL